MKTIHNLNGHSIKDVAYALKDFFKTQDMITEIVMMGDAQCLVKSKNQVYTLVDKVYGNEIACQVELFEDPYGNVIVQIGKGKWLGKAVGAAAAVTTGFLPACWPVYFMMATQAGGVGYSTWKQMSLPEKVDAYIYKYLTANNYILQNER